MSNVHLHWGIGDKGRAMIGQLLAGTTTAVVLIGQESTLLHSLQARENYTVEVRSQSNSELYMIAIDRIILSSAHQAISEIICTADFLSVALEEVNLSDITELLALSLPERRARRGDVPLDLLLIGATEADVAEIYQLLQRHLKEEFPLKEVLGLVSSYPNPLAVQAGDEEGVNLITTPLTDLYVERLAFQGAIPTFGQLRVVDSLHGYHQRNEKLFQVALSVATYSHYHYRKREREFDQRSSIALQRVLVEALEIFLGQHEGLWSREELERYCTELVDYFANPLTIDVLLQEQEAVVRHLGRTGALYQMMEDAHQSGLAYESASRTYRWALDYLLDQVEGTLDDEVTRLAHNIANMSLAKKIDTVTGQCEEMIPKELLYAVAHSAGPSSFTVVTATGLKTYPYDDERTLLENLSEHKEISISAPCGGVGLCGKCRVRIISGQVNQISQQEQRLLRTSDAEQQIRLACQSYFHGDQEIKVQVVQELSHTRVLADYEMTPLAAQQKLNAVSCAFDIGTTTIALYLLDADTQQVIQSHTAVNRQSTFGADVISRINYCQESQTGLKVLHETIVNQMDEMMKTLLTSYQVEDRNLKRVAVVGNPTMMHLLLNLDPTSLAQAPFTLVSEEPTVFVGSEQGFSFASEAQFLISGAVSAYVGSDVTSGVAAVELTATAEAKLYVDVGTNGEIALWDGKRLYCCASAAGPAFEGANISFGMSATDGAIERIYRDAQGQLQSKTIGNVEPVGLCGSGIIDAVAVLLESEAVDSTGAMDEDHPWVQRRAGNLEVVLEGEVSFSAVDVRQVQLAKAAIAAGIATLLATAEVEIEQLSAIYLAGGFGTALPLDSALRIGLLPPVEAHKVRAVGNAAGKGAVLSLAKDSFLSEVERLRQECLYIELSSSAAFMNRYIEEMLFPERE